MALVEMRGLCKAFGRNVVLDGLDLDIYEGEFLTIMGESGSGKSLLMKMMLGLIEPDAGTIRFDGEIMTGKSEAAWRVVRRRTGMLFQEGALFDSFNVFENVAYGLYEQTDFSEEQIHARVAESLALVDLPGIEHMWPASLSGGMRKRVALARAVAVHPEMIFYDEPTEGLDPINVTRVNRLMLGLQEKLENTSIVATHNLKSAFATSNRLALIHEGRVHITGTPDSFRDSRDAILRQFIGVRAGLISLHPPPAL